MAEASVIEPVVESVVTPSWRDSLPEDIRSAPELVKYKSVDELAKGHLSQSKLVGTKQALSIPGADAKPEDVAAFHKALGVPATPAEYKIKAHEIMAHPEWNREAQGEFLKVAHAVGMTPEQVNTALGFYANFIGGQVKDNQKLETEAKVELRNDWGANYDTYLGAANRGMERVAQALGVDRADIFEATKGSDPALVARVFHFVESQFLEHGFVQGEPIQDVNPAEAAEQVRTLTAQLLAVPAESDQAKMLIDQIAAYGRAMSRAA